LAFSLAYKTYKLFNEIVQFSYIFGNKPRAVRKSLR